MSTLSQILDAHIAMESITSACNAKKLEYGCAGGLVKWCLNANAPVVAVAMGTQFIVCLAEEC